VFIKACLDIALNVDRLRVYYFSQFGIVKAVDDVSLSVGKNESIGIVGESGCGKSTIGTALLRSITYPGRTVSGNIMLEGQDITKMSGEEFDNKVRWKKISMIFQAALNTLDPVFNIGSQMEEILQQHGYSNDHMDLIIDSLHSVLLDANIMKKYPHELSGGMRQRVSIAMSLLLNPHILIADEPTTSLDVMVQSQIINLLKKLKKDRNMSIIFISHDLGVISEVSDTIAIMYRGQIVEVGKAYNIYKKAKHPYTEKLVTSIPNISSKEINFEYLHEKSEDLSIIESGCKFYDGCPYAKEKCLEDPPVIKYKDGFVRCWLYE
jgi:peptide/nickel transport system ATP-binding protein